METRKLRDGTSAKIEVATKTCSGCKKELKASMFPIDRRSKDSLWRLCRKCESKRKKQGKKSKPKPKK